MQIWSIYQVIISLVMLVQMLVEKGRFKVENITGQFWVVKKQIERRRAYRGGCWRREQRMNGWMRFLWEFSSKHSLPHCFGLQGSKYLYLCFSVYLYLQYSAHSIVFPCCCIDLFPLGGKATWQTCEEGKGGSRNCQPGNLKKTLNFCNGHFMRSDIHHSHKRKNVPEN